MKLSITTYNIFRNWDLATLCAELPRAGVQAVEFRIEAGHRHGVELTTDTAQRQGIRGKLEAAGLFCCSIATGFRFHFSEPEKVKENIVGTKKAIELAADLGAPFVRVFGNDVPPGSDPTAVAERVGSALAELGPVAERAGVSVLLEMHGDFNDWWLNRRALERANHRAVACLYNCDDRDVIAGSVRSVWYEMKRWIRHIHFHDLTSKSYPYAELFRLLAADGYGGFMSMEVSMEGDVTANLHAQAKE
ncbi:MAG: sugar phosphate isomerase/epimerase family protein, partial [Kiritimatiellia bacterium]